MMYWELIWLYGEAASIVLLPWRGWKYLTSTTWSTGIVTAGLYLFSAVCQTEEDRESNMGQMFWPHSAVLWWWDTSVIIFPAKACQEQYLLLYIWVALFMYMYCYILAEKAISIKFYFKISVYSFQKYTNYLINSNSFYFYIR